MGLSFFYSFCDETPSRFDNGWVRDSTNERTHEDVLQLFVISARPLFDFGDPILKMAQPRKIGHCAKAIIKGLLVGEHCTPFFEMVLEDTLVELMENVGRDAEKDVRVGEFRPEWGEDRAKAVSNKVGRIMANCLSMENM